MQVPLRSINPFIIGITLNTIWDNNCIIIKPMEFV